MTDVGCSLTMDITLEIHCFVVADMLVKAYVLSYIDI